jgi:DNA polymerase V
MHRKEDIEKVLRKTPVEDVWGIGRRSTPRLKARGVVTAYDFSQLPKEWVQRNFGITGVRTWQELNGIPAIGFEASASSKQSICNSRSFAKEIYDIKELSEQIAKFAVMTAEKLRMQKSVCQRLTVFAATNRFHEDELQQYGHISLPFIEPTDSSLEIVRAAREALGEIFVRGVGYKKAGVIASEITPRDGLHISMFAAEHNERHRRLMEAIDNINNTVGSEAVTLASAGKGAPLNRSDFRSPRYTTSWEDIPIIK